MQGFQQAKMKGRRADAAAGEGKAGKIGRHLSRRLEREIVGLIVPIEDRLPAVGDVRVLFLIILDQGSRLISKGALADFVGLRRNRFAGGKNDRSGQQQAPDRWKGDSSGWYVVLRILRATHEYPNLYGYGQSRQRFNP